MADLTPDTDPRNEPGADPTPGPTPGADTSPGADPTPIRGAPQPGPTARRGFAIGRGAGLLIGIALVSAGAIALLSAIAVITLRPTDLAAPALSSPSPSAAAAVGTPTPPDGEAAARALTTLMGGATATFHVEADGRIGLDRSVGTLAFAVDVDRPDAAGRLTGTLIGPLRDFVHADGGAWTRPAGGDWTSQPAFRPNRGWDPFSGLTASAVDVTFERWETTATDRLAILRLEGIVALDPLDFLDIDLTDVSVDDSELIVAASADGTPRRATWSIHESGADADGVRHTIQGIFDYTFSKVGEPVTITAPG